MGKKLGKGFARLATRLGYEPAAEGMPFDFTSQDGAIVAKTPSSVRGTRDLRAAVMDLAITVAQSTTIRRATLIVVDHKMRDETIRNEWNAACAALRPKLQRRLELVAISHHGTVIVPDDHPLLRELADMLRKTRFTPAHRQPSKVQMSVPGAALYHQSMSRPPVYYVVLHILLARYLRHEGAISNTNLADLAGCSYPTLAKALRRLEPHLASHTNRSVELESWPHSAWDELASLAPRIRPATRFTDASGEEPRPGQLLERLRKLRIAGVAVGGVFAAHHWDPQLDLHGIPRLDLSLHTPDGDADLSFVRKLDPALRPQLDPNGPTSLVIHPAYRAHALFERNHDGELHWTDPVDTLLDLRELRLNKQADELVARLYNREAKR